MHYLKPDVKIEPLVQRWYAWIHLVPPMQCALNLEYRYKGLLQSFVANPNIHHNAANDPAMYGGPFMGLTIDDKSFAQSLQKQMSDEFYQLSNLAVEYRKFELALTDAAKGQSLEEFYKLVPDQLAGALELVYDTSNNANIRLFEDLLPDLGFSTQPLQSISLTREAEEDRQFFLSTPRTYSENRLDLELDFKNPMIDTLAKMRVQSFNFEDIVEELGLDATQKDRFSEMCTEQPTARNSPNYNGDKVRVRYFGHACVLLETSEVSILIDPLLSTNADASDDRFSIADLPDTIDYIIITHGHQDHLVPEILLQLRHKTKHVLVPRNNQGSIADPSLKLIFKDLGFQSVTALDPFEITSIKDGEIWSLPFPGEHCDLDILTKHALFIHLKGFKALFMVDSNAVEPKLYSNIQRRIGDIDMAFIGMECDGAPLSWLYGPFMPRPLVRSSDEARSMSSSKAEEAITALDYFNCKEVCIYAMGQEPWLKHLMGLVYETDSVQLNEARKFIELCSERDILAKQLYISEEFER